MYKKFTYKKLMLFVFGLSLVFGQFGVAHASQSPVVSKTCPKNFVLQGTECISKKTKRLNQLYCRSQRVMTYEKCMKSKGYK